jgi:hypothetical protein
MLSKLHSYLLSWRKVIFISEALKRNRDIPRTGSKECAKNPE